MAFNFCLKEKRNLLVVFQSLCNREEEGRECFLCAGERIMWKTTALGQLLYFSNCAEKSVFN